MKTTAQLTISKAIATGNANWSRKAEPTPSSSSFGLINNDKSVNCVRTPRGMPHTNEATRIRHASLRIGSVRQS